MHSDGHLLFLCCFMYRFIRSEFWVITAKNHFLESNTSFLQICFALVGFYIRCLSWDLSNCDFFFSLPKYLLSSTRKILQVSTRDWTSIHCVCTSFSTERHHWNLIKQNVFGSKYLMFDHFKLE